jgi:hypothetical protein
MAQAPCAGCYPGVSIGVASGIALGVARHLHQLPRLDAMTRA